IEDDDVGGRAFAQEPAVVQAEALGGVSGEVLYGLFQRPRAVAVDVVAEVAGETATTARVRVTTRENAVAARHVGGVSHERPNVVLRSPAVRGDTAGRQLRCEEHVTDEIRQWTPGSFGRLTESLSLVFAPIGGIDVTESNVIQGAARSRQLF